MVFRGRYFTRKLKTEEIEMSFYDEIKDYGSVYEIDNIDLFMMRMTSDGIKNAVSRNTRSEVFWSTAIYSKPAELLSCRLERVALNDGDVPLILGKHFCPSFQNAHAFITGCGISNDVVFLPDIEFRLILLYNLLSENGKIRGEIRILPHYWDIGISDPEYREWKRIRKPKASTRAPMTAESTGLLNIVFAIQEYFCTIPVWKPVYTYTRGFSRIKVRESKWW